MNRSNLGLFSNARLKKDTNYFQALNEYYSKIMYVNANVRYYQVGLQFGRINRVSMKETTIKMRRVEMKHFRIFLVYFRSDVGIV